MENNLREWKKLIEDCGEINSTASEHDHEASMARGQLYHVAKDAIRLIKMIEKGDQLQGWVASKITKAKETISVVADYMEAEMTVNNNNSPEVTHSEGKAPDSPEHDCGPECETYGCQCGTAKSEASEDRGMNKYGLSARNKDGKFHSYRNDKLTGSFDSMEELARHQEELIKDE